MINACAAVMAATLTNDHIDTLVASRKTGFEKIK